MGLVSSVCPLGLRSSLCPGVGFLASFGSFPCLFLVRVGLVRFRVPSCALGARRSSVAFGLLFPSWFFPWSFSFVEWHGTFRHQPCGFRVSACRRLYSRLSPSPLRASSRAFFALRSPSGFGSRSLVLPPALASAMPRIFTIPLLCSAFLDVYMCSYEYPFAVPPGCINTLG